MKYGVLFVGLLLAGVEAQKRSHGEQTQDQKLLSCANKCLNKAVKTTNCHAKNHNCVCSKDSFMGTMGHCVEKNCGDVTNAYKFALDQAGYFCTDGRHPSSIPYVTGKSKENGKSYEFEHWLPFWDWWRHWVDEDPEKCKENECDYLSKQKGFKAWKSFWGKHNKGWEHWKSPCNPKHQNPAPGYPSGGNPSPNPNWPWPAPSKPSPGPSYPPPKSPSPNPYPPPNPPSYRPPGNPYPSPNPYPPSNPPHYNPPSPTQTVLPYY